MQYCWWGISFEFDTPKAPLCKGQISPLAGKMSAKRTKGARARQGCQPSRLTGGLYSNHLQITNISWKFVSVPSNPSVTAYTVTPPFTQGRLLWAVDLDPLSGVRDPPRSFAAPMMGECDLREFALLRRA